MPVNMPDPTNSFPAVRTYAVTEEDVRVSDWLPEFLKKGDGLSKEEMARKRAELELQLIAHFENVPDPIIPLGSAGALNVSTSELRVIGARAVVDLLLQVQYTGPERRRLEAERMEREVREAREAEQARKKEEEKEGAESTERTAVAPDTTLETTQPSQNLDHLLRVLGKDRGKNEEGSPNTALGKSQQDERSVSRQEITSPATGRKAEHEEGTTATAAPKDPTDRSAHKVEEKSEKK